MCVCRSLSGVRWLFDFKICLLCVALCVCSWLFVLGCLFVVCLLLVVWCLAFGVRWVLFVVCGAVRALRFALLVVGCLIIVDCW